MEEIKLTEREMRVLLSTLNEGRVRDGVVNLFGALLKRIDDLEIDCRLERFRREQAEEELATLKAEKEAKDGENV